MIKMMQIQNINYVKKILKYLYKRKIIFSNKGECQYKAVLMTSHTSNVFYIGLKENLFNYMKEKKKC